MSSSGNIDSIDDRAVTAATNNNNDKSPTTITTKTASTATASTTMEKLELLSETAFAAATGAAPPSIAQSSSFSSMATATPVNGTISIAGAAGLENEHGGNSHHPSASRVKSPSGWMIGSNNTSLANTPIVNSGGVGVGGTGSGAAAAAAAEAAGILSSRSMSGGNLLLLEESRHQQSPSSYRGLQPRVTAAALSTKTGLDDPSPSTGPSPVLSEEEQAEIQKGGPKRHSASSSPTYLYDSNRADQIVLTTGRSARPSPRNIHDKQEHDSRALPSVVSYPQLQPPPPPSSHIHHHASAFAPPVSSSSSSPSANRPAAEGLTGSNTAAHGNLTTSAEKVGLEGSSFTAYQAPTWTSTLSSSSPLPVDDKATSNLKSQGPAGASNGIRMTVDVQFHQHSNRHHQYSHGHQSPFEHGSISRSESLDAEAGGLHRLGRHTMDDVGKQKTLSPFSITSTASRRIGDVLSPPPIAPHHQHHNHHPPSVGGAPFHQHHHHHHRHVGGHHDDHHPHGPHGHQLTHHVTTAAAYDEVLRENALLKQQLKEKDVVNSSLQHRVNYLENQIHELRQLPTGKISHIPVDDMIRIMQEYGSEVSSQILPQRKYPIQKASIVRQFRRWNPEFFRYFLHVNGEWVPKLGREGELRRRAEKRREIKQQAAKTAQQHK